MRQQESQMGWQQIRQSVLMKNIKTNKKQNNSNSNQMLDHQIMQKNIRKSYLYQNATKNKKKKKQNDTNTAMKKYAITFRESKVPMTVSKIFSKQIQKNYNLYVTNQGKQSANIFDFCGSKCDGSSKNIMKKCLLSKYQLKILNNNKTSLQKTNNNNNIHDSNSKQELYCYLNFETIKCKVVEEQFAKNSFLLHVNQHLILKFGVQPFSTTINNYNSDKNQGNNKTNMSLTTTKLKQFKQNIKLLINNSNGKKYNMLQIQSKDSETKLKLINQSKFYKKHYKSAVQFSQNCQTGDIILFRGSHFFGGVQRLLTNSEYDHVGMIIKDPTYGVLIFQSTGLSGVCLVSWDFMMKQQLFKYTEQFVWRRLTGIQRDYQFKALIHQFVTANLHAKYYISFQKLTMTTSVIPKKSKDPSKKQQQNGFFCSQLVAKIYKNLGLLTKDPKDRDYKASNNFYPYHFTQKFNLNLLKGELSQQYLLYFHGEQIKDYYMK